MTLRDSKAIAVTALVRDSQRLTESDTDDTTRRMRRRLLCLPGCNQKQTNALVQPKHEMDGEKEMGTLGNQSDLLLGYGNYMYIDTGSREEMEM